VTGPAAAGPERRLLAVERESSLRARLIARDESALVELIDVASPWLLGLVQSMLSDGLEAEDVVLETFRIAWDKVGTLPAGEEQRLLPWLFRIARNRAIDQLRSRRRYRNKLDRVEVVSAGGDHAVVPVEPDEAAQPGWHVHRTVHAALDLLPPDQHAAVELAYFRGLTQSEIATELGIPLGTVKTRLRLAFDKLRSTLAPLKDWVL
jgi:RNA polymerase sigma-70 factor, ECF subfamily